MDYVLRAYADYKKSGHYPNGKGLDDQPAVLIEDFDTLSSILDYQMLHKDEWLEK